jgi:hypothetical protein
VKPRNKNAAQRQRHARKRKGRLRRDSIKGELINAGKNRNAQKSCGRLRGTAFWQPSCETTCNQTI